ncbi:type II toxin-antitoxin system RelE/ParE family toxin [Salmonella enterica subsp. enterica serovar Newport]|nr:type II toxin-antitoxin system RelE/ParE family toxin [Salmonella enterica subsp. enterica serovar Newport]
MRYQVIYLQEAEEHLADLLDYIFWESRSLVTAESYVNGVKRYCDGLETLPHRGTPRDDLLPGLRITNWRKRTVVAFVVDDATHTVIITGIFHGGRDYETTYRMLKPV